MSFSDFPEWDDDQEYLINLEPYYLSARTKKEKQAKKKNANINQTKERIECLEMELLRSQEIREVLEHKVEFLERERCELQEEGYDLRDSLQMAYKMLGDREKTLQSEKKVLAQEFDKIKHIVFEMGELLDKRVDTDDELFQHCQELKTSNQILRDKVSSLEGSKDCLRNDLDAAREDLQRVNGDLVKANDQLQQSERRQQKDLDEKDGVIAKLKRIIKRQKRDLKASRKLNSKISRDKEMSDLRADLLQSRHEVEELRKKLARLPTNPDP